MTDRYTFALGIPHCAWDPTRVRTLARLRRQLQGEPGGPHYPWGSAGQLFSEPGPSPNWVWSQKMWEWGAGQPVTHFLTIQDDCMVADNFWPALQAMVAAVPGGVIGLEAIHPIGPRLCEKRARWYTTSDCLAGAAYVVPIVTLQAFRHWMAHDLRDGAIKRINEDTLLGLFCASTGRRIYHPLPTIIDHDVTVKSNYGNDKHQHRRPCVCWHDKRVIAETCGRDIIPTNKHVDSWPAYWTAADLESVEFWDPAKQGLSQDGGAVHLGRFYDATPHFFTRFVRPVPALSLAVTDADRTWEQTADRIAGDLVRIEVQRQPTQRAQSVGGMGQGLAEGLK